MGATAPVDPGWKSRKCRKKKVPTSGIDLQANKEEEEMDSVYNHQDGGTIIKRAIVTVMKEGGDHNKYKPAIVAQIKCWLWVSLVRKSVFLMDQVLELCKACKIDYFAMLSAAFEASLKAREEDDFMHPKFWQPREGGLSQADCAAMIPEDHLDAWKEVSEGNACVIVRCVYFGRGFYFSNKAMETRIMSAAQANLLWSENKRDFFTALFRETCSDFLMSLARANVAASHKMRRFHKGMPPEGVPALEGTFTFQNVRILEADYLREGTEAENRYDVACEIYTSACGSFRQLVLRLTPEASPEVRTSDNRAQHDMEEEGEDFDALLNEIFKG